MYAILRLLWKWIKENELIVSEEFQKCVVISSYSVRLGSVLLKVWTANTANSKWWDLEVGPQNNVADIYENSRHFKLYDKFSLWDNFMHHLQKMEFLSRLQKWLKANNAEEKSMILFWTNL